MKVLSSSSLFLLATLAIRLLVPCDLSAQQLDDRAITIHSASDVAEKRRALIQFIWGADGFPAKRRS